MFNETITAASDLIHSQILERIFDRISEHGAAYEVLAFDIGRTKDDHSFAKLRHSASDEAALSALLETLVPYGCRLESERDARFDVAPKDRCVPEDFYSTTNYRTQVRVNGAWSNIGKQRMDAVIVMEDSAPVSRKLRDVRRGDQVVCGMEGIRVAPEFRGRDKQSFAFMSNEISSERRVETSAAKFADMMREVRASGGRIAVVARPVVIHTGPRRSAAPQVTGGAAEPLERREQRSRASTEANRRSDVRRLLDYPPYPLPIVVGGGVFRGGRHLRQRALTPLCKLYVRVLRAFGCEDERFGDSTGELAGLA